MEKSNNKSSEFKDPSSSNGFISDDVVLNKMLSEIRIEEYGNSIRQDALSNELFVTDFTVVEEKLAEWKSKTNDPDKKELLTAMLTSLSRMFLYGSSENHHKHLERSDRITYYNLTRNENLRMRSLINDLQKENEFLKKQIENGL